MAKKAHFLLLILLVLSGCSAEKWTASFYLVQAENAVDQAWKMKDRKEPFEKRRVYYAKACGLFAKAYEKNDTVFSLARIEAAVDACWKAENEEQENVFRWFQEEYIKNHPQEYEYGDSGMGMMDMGG